MTFEPVVVMDGVVYDDSIERTHRLMLCLARSSVESASLVSAF